ncbi:MAG TPA: chalcone isomerase family protein [Deltaproteobacteria bacterium]|nr:chalcone isomerase family protein [Deltaproteobacteria bacterium]
MVKKVLGILLVSFFLATTGFSLDLGKANMPDTISAGGTNLVINGGGLRSKWMMKVYAIGLYLPQKSGNAQAIMGADQPMALKLQVTSGLVTKEKLIGAIKEGFEASTGGNIAPIKAQYDQFFAAMTDEVKNGDVFDFIYLPGKGLQCIKNGAVKTTVAGLEFKKAYFGIWLGAKPAQADLKDKMLGK